MNFDQVPALIAELAAHTPDGVWAAVSAAATLFVLWQSKQAIAKASTPAADLLTYAAAAIATGVSAQGMWHFFEVVFPGLPVPLRVALFAFIEIGMLASAVRARRNMRDSAERAKTDPLVRPSAGVDGTAVWVLTALTAVLSSLEAASPPEFIFRLAAPLVAAWLWERGMAIERQRITGRSRINWRLTPERLLVRLGLAEANDRTASEVDAHRRLTRVALAAKKAKALRDVGAKPKKVARALARLDRAMDRAVEHTALSRDRVVMTALLDQVSTLYGAPRLLDLPGQAPWEHLDHPAVTGLIRDSEAVILAAALDRNTALRGEVYPRPVATGDQMGDQDASNGASTSGLDGKALPPAPKGRLLLKALVPWSRPSSRPDAAKVAGDDDAVSADADLDAKVDAETGEVASRSRPDADSDDDRPEPTEQDKKRVARWWVKRVEADEVLSKWGLADRTGFKPTWCSDRIADGKQILARKGWTFDDRGRPVRPAEVDADLDASTLNGSTPTAPTGDQS